MSPLPTANLYRLTDKYFFFLLNRFPWDGFCSGWFLNKPGCHNLLLKSARLLTWPRLHRGLDAECRRVWNTVCPDRLRFASHYGFEDCKQVGQPLEKQLIGPFQGGFWMCWGNALRSLCHSSPFAAFWLCGIWVGLLVGQWHDPLDVQGWSTYETSESLLLRLMRVGTSSYFVLGYLLPSVTV